VRIPRGPATVKAVFFLFTATVKYMGRLRKICSEWSNELESGDLPEVYVVTYELFVDRECDYLRGLLFLCLRASPLSSFRPNRV
jgi:hypothetical protein